MGIHWLDGLIFVVLWAAFLWWTGRSYRRTPRDEAAECLRLTREARVYDWQRDGL